MVLCSLEKLEDFCKLSFSYTREHKLCGFNHKNPFQNISESTCLHLVILNFVRKGMQFLFCCIMLMDQRYYVNLRFHRYIGEYESFNGKHFISLSLVHEI